MCVRPESGYYFLQNSNAPRSNRRPKKEHIEVEGRELVVSNT